MNDTVVKELPLLYKGAGCTTSIASTDEKTDGPDHIRVSRDQKTLYISVGGGFGVMDARARQEILVDITNPADPRQLASVPVGDSTSHHGDALSGDGKYLFVANTVSNSVTVIDTSNNTVARTIMTQVKPLTVGSFGASEGPSAQTGPIE